MSNSVNLKSFDKIRLKVSKIVLYQAKESPGHVLDVLLNR